MPPSSTESRVRYVTHGENEALLAAVEARTANPAAGIFGPGSASWKINRESALFLGAGRASILQLAHPWIAAALAEHSSVLARPIARFHNTFRIVFTMVFGASDQALAAARHLYALHARIRGEITEEVAAYSRGSHYQANEIAALRWVYSTLVESAVLAYEAALGALAPEELEAYYSETKTLAALFGLPAAALPADWDSFRAYNCEMTASNSLGVTSAARNMGHNLLSGAGSWVRPPRWYRALTTQWLPERFRDEFVLELSDADRRTAEGALQRLPGLYRRLPASIRFVGPWHEAQARLRHRRGGILTGLGNRFWIGEPRLPFCTEDRDQRQ